QRSPTAQQMLNCDEPDTLDESQTRCFAQTKSSDELGALEEAIPSVEQIAIPDRRPVNLQPRSAFL
ncbi:MAG TPA: single-stranded DNA-binding protein, partial [Coleofasciculaceae cyanobacterium]